MLYFPNFCARTPNASLPMDLFSIDRLTKTLGLRKYGLLGTIFTRMYFQISGLLLVKRLHQKHRNNNAESYIEGILKDLEIQSHLPEAHLNRFPKKGPFVVLANHPLGFIDGLLLMQLMLNLRPDFKIIANFLLQEIEPFKPHIIPIDPFEHKVSQPKNITGTRALLEHLKTGKSLVVFPAGEVASKLHPQSHYPIDAPWKPGLMKLLQKQKVPIVPVYFHAKNSPLFYRMSRWGNFFRTAKLPSEIFTQRFRKIELRVGNPIGFKDYQQLENSPELFTEFIRARTFLLSRSFEARKIKVRVPKTLRIPRKPKPIIAPVPTHLLQAEIEDLSHSQSLLFTHRDYHIFLAPAGQIPNLLQEIGRLREITFRSIGEGTLKSLDLDAWDPHYRHLILWDNKVRTLVGAYRMGFGKELEKLITPQRLYVTSLFQFDAVLAPMLSETIEMGRAFVIKEYQLRPMPLYLLWKGIALVTLKFPAYKYLMGGVSISNTFTNFSKSMLIDYMRSHYYDAAVAQYIKPKKKVKINLTEQDLELLNQPSLDLQFLDKIIQEIEPESLRIPVLIKKYVKQNARVISFNRDPLFNDAIDALMYLKIQELPESTLKPALEEYQKQLESKTP